MILSVDLGKKTTGLAISSGTIAQPYKTITHKNLNDAVNKISNICNEESVDILVVGFVEGRIKEYFEEFTKNFKVKNPNIRVELIDETLTSRQAADTMINLDQQRSKRKEKEHEVAAALILESYLREND